MHSLGARASYFASHAASALVALGIVAALLDLPTRREPASARAFLPESPKLATRASGEHEVGVVAALDADFRPAFNWNTKLVFVMLLAEMELPTLGRYEQTLWDARLQFAEDASLRLRRILPKYPILGRSESLAGLPFNLSLAYSVIPYCGAIHYGRLHLLSSSFPASPN